MAKSEKKEKSVELSAVKCVYIFGDTLKYKHFQRGNADILDLSKTVIENGTSQKKVSMLLLTLHKKLRVRVF